MKAVFQTGHKLEWAEAVDSIPWPLLSLGNRPVLEYWFDLCVELGVEEVQIVLGEGAYAIERFASEGRRWGLNLSYSFLRSGGNPDVYLKRDPARWCDGGLFYVRHPVFFRKNAEYSAERLKNSNHWFCGGNGVLLACILNDTSLIDRFIAGEDISAKTETRNRQRGMEAVALDSIQVYFNLNLDLVGGESKKYVTPGYSSQDGNYVGYDVIYPASASLAPPIMIGNHCRIQPGCEIGPNAVIGNNVLIDRNTDLSNCIVLDGSYVGMRMEMKNKIVAGKKLIDPEDGTVLEIGDSWLLDSVPDHLVRRDVFRAIAGWLLALLCTLLGLLPFLILHPLLLLTKTARFEKKAFFGRKGLKRIFPVLKTIRPKKPLLRLFNALLLDRYPLLFFVLRGRLWLCGNRLLDEDQSELRAELKQYFPAVLDYHQTRAGTTVEGDLKCDILYYNNIRSVREDISILINSILRRIVGFGA